MAKWLDIQTQADHFNLQGNFIIRFGSNKVSGGMVVCNNYSEGSQKYDIFH